jgi:cytochrome bd ubiquinol oxidase subunit II
MPQPSLPPMQLADVPLILLLLGLAAYAVLGGADFGAGFWQLWGGRGEREKAIREHAHHAMGPVWETNHVWLIFVLVICWTAYPTAFGSIASTLSVPLFIAAIGIIMRGTTYALRSGAATPREQRRIEVAFAISSILTPFALGAVIGGIASRRVPVGNAKGDLVTSWLNETSIFIGVLAVATAAYLAAVYLAADAVRIGRADLEQAFRARALAMGVVAGALALGGLAIVHEDAPEIWDGLTTGGGLAAVIVSGAAGVATMLLLLRSRYELARVTAALAVAAIVAGWALAQRPDILPGLTVEEAAASHFALVAVIVGVALGSVLLLPSLALLVWLFLRGCFDPHVVQPEPVQVAAPRPSHVRPHLGLAALACLVVGGTLTFFFETSWAHIIGVSALLAFVGLGFVALAAAIAAGDQPD